MNKKEIKDYLKRVDELETKLMGEDKETYDWLIYGYNQCAKLLNETEQQCKKQKEVIDKINHILNNQINYREFVDIVNAIEDVVKEVG
jgi:heterodisulfide reductase subunit B